MGWNRSSDTSVKPQSAHRSQKSAVVRGGLAASLVIIGAIASWLVVSQRSDKSEAQHTSERSKQQIQEVTPSAAPVVKPVEVDKFKGLDKSRLRKAANGSTVYLPKPGEERYPGERAQALAMMSGTNGFRIDRRVVEDPEHPFMFHNPIQSDLVQFARPGEFAVPINPNVKDEEAWEAIKSPIVDHYNDSDRQLEEKQYVRDLMQDLKKHMEEGGHARDYFNQLAERQAAEEETMRKTREDVQALINEGKMQDAKEALDIYNQYLQQKNLPILRFRKLNGPQLQPKPDQSSVE